MTPLYQAITRIPPEERDQQALAKNSNAREQFELLDTALASRAYLGRNNFTLGDICVAVIAYRWFGLEIERKSPLLNLARRYEAVSSRPGFQAHVVMPLQSCGELLRDELSET